MLSGKENKNSKEESFVVPWAKWLKFSHLNNLKNIH